MVAALMVAGLAATALVAAAALRLPDVAATLLAAYVAAAAETAAVTGALSPFHAVSRPAVGAAEAVLLAAAATAWWLAGRPRVGIVRAAAGVRELARDPVVAGFLALAAVALAYELVLVLTVPPNNWDSLTYHLARAAAWLRHGGVYWIPHAPTDRMNEFQPLAEQQILFLFVAAGGGALFALPQLVAEAALLVGVFAAARRLGHGPRAAACTAAIFASFTLVALESTTAQNDLVAASLPLAAAAFLLGRRQTGGETALAGAAVGLGLAVKLTTALVLPVVVLLALRRGRRALLVLSGTAAACFAALGSWSFVLNVVHTGHLLGRGGGRVEHTASPNFPGSGWTAWEIAARLLDLSGFSVTAIAALWVAGGAFLLAGYRSARRREAGPVAAFAWGAAAALPLLTPLLVVVLAALDRAAMDFVRLETHDVNTRVNEDFSAFGPLGGLALVTAAVLALLGSVRRRADLRFLALGLALPLFLVLLGLGSRYNPFLARFLLVPAALTAPLLARFFGRRDVSAAMLACAAATLGLALWKNELKPLGTSAGAPWRLTRAGAVELNWKPQAGRVVARLDRLLPADACVGAALDVDEPSYLLYGPRLRRRVTFLPLDRAPGAAAGAGLRAVVIGSGAAARVRAGFAAGGWRLRPLGGSYWTLATRPGAGRCPGQ